MIGPEEDISERLRSFYAAKAPSPEALARLREAAASGGEEPRVTLGRGGRWSWLRGPGLVAAAAVLCGLALAIYLSWSVPAKVNRNRLLRLAGEIALNHSKQLRPDVTARDYGELVQLLSKLEFTPIEPERVRGQGYQLVGARYCSVGRSFAVQLRLVHPTHNHSLTIYEMRPGDESIAELEETHFEVDGVHVELWRESGLIVGLARSSNPL